MHPLAFQSKADPITLVMESPALLAGRSSSRDADTVLWERPVILVDIAGGSSVCDRDACTEPLAHVHGMYVARVGLSADSGPRWTAVTWLESPEDLTHGPEQAFYTEIDAHAWAITTLHGACGTGRVITGRRLA